MDHLNNLIKNQLGNHHNFQLRSNSSQELLRTFWSPKKKILNNITPEQNDLMKKLKQNHSILVKKTDKAAAEDILQTSDYLRDVYRQLNDYIFYLFLVYFNYKLDRDITGEVSDSHCRNLPIS